MAAGCNLEVTVEKLKLAAHQRPFMKSNEFIAPQLIRVLDASDAILLGTCK